MSGDSVSTEKKVGNVKWFNNKAGYGFITMDENSGSPIDVFVHYSNINVSNSQYKYLVQGEYVEFTLASASEDSKHEFQAIGVTGIQGGATLCERRRLLSRENDEEVERPIRDSKPRVRSSDNVNRTRRPIAPRRRDAPRDRESFEDDEGFTTVKKKIMSRTTSV